MKSKLANLMDVKSIVTIVLTLVFAVLSLGGAVSADYFLTVYTVIISFFFGTKYQKNQEVK